MERYAEAFERAGVTSLFQVANLSLKDLQRHMGIALAGHQKKIMQVSRLTENKAGYMASQVACGWAGAVLNKAGYLATQVACGRAGAMRKKANREGAAMQTTPINAKKAKCY